MQQYRNCCPTYFLAVAVRLLTMKTLFITLFSVAVCLNGQAQSIDTLLNVGTYRLHFHIIKGTGVPILFESGGGDDATAWNKLLKPLQQQTNATLITYDRAGIGKSEIDTTKIDIVNEVKGLEIGLKKLGYFANLVVVAHSLGGTYVTLLSERNNQVIKGVVFVDCNLPCFNDQATAKKLKNSLNDKMAYFKQHSIGTYYSILNYERSNALFREITFPATIPATVISADIAPFNGVDGARWKACQKSFGERSNHSYVLAKGSKHYIYQDDPELVVSEVVNLYRRAVAKKD
jgi:alpha/beta hydrolase fold